MGGGKRRAPIDDPQDRAMADEFDAEADDMLACPVEGGEIRRLTMLFADLVDSTALSTQVEP